MTVRELIKELEKAPADSDVGFFLFQSHPVGSVKIGRMPNADRGYVLLYAKGKASPQTPPRPAD